MDRNSLRPRGALWRHGDFLRLWSGEAISAFGTQISTLALPFIAVTILRTSAARVAALVTLEYLPVALFSLPAGVWVDRLRRRPILIACSCGRALVLMAIPLCYWADALSIWVLYVVGFLVGAMTIFFDIAYQSYLPSLVEREHLPEANAKLNTTQSSSLVGGPAIAGLLIAAITAPYAVCVDAASFVLSAVSVMRIRTREAFEPQPTEGRSIRREVAEGLRFVLTHPYLRPILIGGAVSNFFTNGLFAIFVVYLVRTLGLSAAQIGAAFAIGNVGGVIGAVLARRMSARVGIGPAIVGGMAVANVGWLLIPLAPRSLAMPLTSVALFLFGAGSLVAVIAFVSLSQAVTPDELFGRMAASRRFALLGVIPLGALLAGALASTSGLHAAIWVCAIGSSLAFLPLLLSSVRSIRTLEGAEAALVRR
jgi:MFS family permease